MVYIIFGQAVVALILNYFPAFGFDWRGLRDAEVRRPADHRSWWSINLGYDVRLYRAIFLEEIAQDYVRTALRQGRSLAAACSACMSSRTASSR